MARRKDEISQDILCACISGSPCVCVLMRVGAKTQLQVSFLGCHLFFGGGFCFLELESPTGLELIN